MFIRPERESQQVTLGSGFEKKVLLKKISEMEDLPSLDVNMVSIIDLLGDQNVDIDDLVKAIERDQALVAKLLKIINSAHYGLHQRVDTVERAVLLLGLLKLKHVIYSAAILDFYSGDQMVEWNHAYTSSFLMTRLIQQSAIPPVASLPLSMLMHDIGKVVLRRFSASRFETAVERALADDIPVFQAEEIVLGLDHTDTGGMLLEKWGMPAETHMAARLHHSDEVPSEYVVELAVVQLVNWVDSSARSIRAFPPSQELLHAAGLLELDSEALVQQQREFIERTEQSSEPPA